MSEMSLFMRVPSVAPRGADAVGSLKVCRGGTAVGETREEGGIFNSNLLRCNYSLLIFSYGKSNPKVPGGDKQAADETQ